MSQANAHEQALSLSAAMLAIDDVILLATTGQCPERDLSALLPSLLRQNQARPEDYFLEIAPFEKGRALLVNFLINGASSEHVRYLIQVTVLEEKLSANRALFAQLLQRLNEAESAAEHFPLLHDAMIARFADIYQASVSPAMRKILIHGNPDYLKQPQIAARVRVCLLCAVRAVGLWRAYGGSKWQVIFFRKRFLKALRALRF